MPFVRCPSCDKRVQPPAELVGLLYDCPHCSRAFRVEDPHGTPRRSRSKSFPWAVLFSSIAALCGVITVCVIIARSTASKPDSEQAANGTPTVSKADAKGGEAAPVSTVASGEIDLEKIAKHYREDRVGAETEYRKKRLRVVVNRIAEGGLDWFGAVVELEKPRAGVVSPGKALNDTYAAALRMPPVIFKLSHPNTLGAGKSAVVEGTCAGLTEFEGRPRLTFNDCRVVR